MKQRAIIAILIILTWSAVLSISCSTKPEEQAEAEKNQISGDRLSEITIRNVTDKSIDYEIKTIYSPGDAIKRSLGVGDIDSFPSESGVELTFKQGDIWQKYLLDSKMPYSFRYDENGQLELYEGSHGRDDAEDLAPFVATPMLVVEKMLEMADLDGDDVLYDLGCGDGRIVITAAKKYGARGVGIDLSLERIEESRTNAKEAGVENLVEFRREDATKSDISQATVVTIYLLTESNELLRPILEKQLKPGTLVISHNYDIPGWEKKEIDYTSIKTQDDEEHMIYLYQK
jgi:SAM-dependent methyltransferase